MLFEPLTLPCGLVVPNRIALAPMTNLQSLADGALGDDEYNWLARRADGGFGLVETCASYVALDGKAWPGQLGCDRDDDAPGLARLAERLRRRGAIAIVQLFHGGVRATQKLTGAQVWSASTWREDSPDFEVPRAATADDLARVIDRFAAAAARVQAAGFDGVELHGAHGYLLGQFLSRASNPRDDGWGGAANANRARLIREVMRAVRARVGSRFAVGVRLSLEQGGHAKDLDLDESVEVARWLADDGADWIHASLWNAAAMTKKRPDQHPITVVREAVPRRVPVIACGAIWTRADADAAVARGADMIAVARAAIANPAWAARIADPAWEPRRPPLARAELADRAVSPVFAQYLTRWKNFVAD
ncbi:MAG TPA: NADH:flavin oxidoreductase [Kofleriaceae bacterium]|nr:NADH:flavin oxidoreductase [Kofleriaceae bacterium]